ncbi:MAG: hypothetical protein MHM6MM_000030 [Cercozoa sp. M6MM]
MSSLSPISETDTVSEPDFSLMVEESSSGSLLTPVTLEQVMRDEMLLQCFGHFLDRIMCRENLDFLLAVRGYERLCELTKKASRSSKAAAQIYYTFLHEDCARPVNLSAESMSKIMRRLQRRKKYQPLMFRSLRKEVQHLLETDSIPKFCRSSEYRVYADERMNELRAEALRLDTEAGATPTKKKLSRFRRWRQRRSASTSSINSDSSDASDNGTTSSPTDDSELEHEDGDSTLGSNIDELELDFDDMSIASEDSSAAGSETGRLSSTRIVEFRAEIGADDDPELLRMMDILTQGATKRYLTLSAEKPWIEKHPPLL